MELKFCKDCKFFNDSPGTDEPVCEQTRTEFPNLVTGAKDFTVARCATHRQDGYPSFCGKEAKYFEPK